MNGENEDEDTTQRNYNGRNRQQGVNGRDADRTADVLTDGDDEAPNNANNNEAEEDNTANEDEENRGGDENRGENNG